MSEPETKPVKCCETMPIPGVWSGRKPCKNNAKVERNGKPYCTIHDPERRKAQREESYRASTAKMGREAAERQRKAAKLAMFDELVEAVDSGYGTWAAFSGMYQAYQGMADIHPAHAAELARLKDILDRARKLQEQR